MYSYKIIINKFIISAMVPIITLQYFNINITEFDKSCKLNHTM